MANKMMNDRRRRVDPRQMVRTLGRVLRYVLKNYKFHCIAVLLCILGSALASVQGVLFTQSLIDDYIVPLTQSADPDYGPLAAALVRVACFYAAGILCAYGYNRIMVNVSQGTMSRLRVELFTHMEPCPSGTLTPTPTATSCRYTPTTWTPSGSSSARAFPSW